MLANIDTAAFDRWRGLVAVSEARAPGSVIETFTGAELASVPVGDADDVVAAVARARTAQRAWSLRPAAERAAILERFRGLVLAHRGRIMDVVQAETGKARSGAQEEIMDLLLSARYYAKHGPRLLSPRREQGVFPLATKTVVHHQPKGVIGLIAPWNYPVALSVCDAIPAVMAGNAVVIKPDSQTPFSVLAVVELLYEAGLPRELLAVVPGPGSVVGAAIVDNCDYLMFTGSTATGRRLAEQCGRRLIGISAELGGKNPMIVTCGADLDAVARAAVRACFSNSGQLCMSIERIYVEEPVAEEFTAKFVAAVSAMTLGAAYDFGTDMGSLASADQLKTVAGHVDDAVAKGARVLAGGRARPDLGPFFYEPTVLTGVADDMDCARAETFGPVVSIYPVADVEEAIARANDTDYGLNASVWAGSKREGEQIAARLRCGTVNVDEAYGLGYASIAAPMGGMGVSGLGRRHGPEGLLKYTEPQTVATMRVLTLDPPFGLSNSLWQQAITPVIRLIQALPGR